MLGAAGATGAGAGAGSGAASACTIGAAAWNVAAEWLVLGAAVEPAVVLWPITICSSADRRVCTALIPVRISAIIQRPARAPIAKPPAATIR